jgi:uncharacterized protein YwqG
VSWFPEQDPLETQAFPDELDPDARFRSVGVTFDREWTVPQLPSIEVDWVKDAGWIVQGNVDEPIDAEALMRLEARLAGREGTPRHRMFGHPDQIQNEMRTECELVTNGIYTGDGSFVTHPRRAKLDKNGPLWRLLLQVDSDDAVGTMWGDVGRIYFWIREDALSARAFDRAWLILHSG